MIELELPCCGETARLVDLADDVRCEACGVVAELAADPVAAQSPPALPLVAALAA
jgi:hypothetical protein